jgi:hypothetical protein
VDAWQSRHWRGCMVEIPFHGYQRRKSRISRHAPQILGHVGVSHASSLPITAYWWRYESYPAVYSVIVPLSAVRWIKFTHGYIPPSATFTVMSISSLLGVFDIVLLLTTRPNLFGRLLFAR